MEEYPSNSRKEKSTDSKPPKQDAIATGKVIVRKPSFGRRFKRAFTRDDGRSVFDHVAREVLIPAARDMVADAAREVVERTLYGDSYVNRSRRGRPSSGYFSGNVGSSMKVNYNRPSYLQDPRQKQEPTRSVTTRGNVDVNDIILESRVEAEEVLSRLEALIVQYGRASVSDLFDLVGVTGQYTDEKFGWVNLENARPHRVREGYLLDLPLPSQLD